MYLDWQWFTKEFFEEVLLGRLTHEHAFGIIVIIRPVGSSHHLKNVRDGVVFIRMDLKLHQQ
jgi:hypothetical protein